jgi:hypothetical protein
MPFSTYSPIILANQCYAFGSHNDISKDFQGISAAEACKGAARHMVQDDDASSNIHYTAPIRSRLQLREIT